MGLCLGKVEGKKVGSCEVGKTPGERVGSTEGEIDLDISNGRILGSSEHLG